MSTTINKKKKANHLNELSGKEWVQLTKSWFTLKVRPRSKSKLKHPGKFPEELVERFILFFTKKDKWIIDPFLGTGSTLVSCRELDRNGIGIEINPKFVRISKSSLRQETLFPTTSQIILQGNALELDFLLKKQFGDAIPKFSLCMTSPPYWNMLAKHRGGSDSQHRDRIKKGLPLVYSNLDDDISNIVDYKEYLDKLIIVFRRLKPFMDKNSYLVVIMQNIRDEKGEFVPIAWDFSYRMKELYSVKQEQIWCQTDKKLGIWGFPTTYVANVHHHYCLVFQNSL